MAKIVIVEDDQPIREMYQLKLEKAGYDVKSAADGVKGLELIQNFKPDLVLLDLLIPQMSGDELLAKVRKTKDLAKTRVLVLTNVSEDEAPASLKSLNVERYMIKAHYTPKQVVDIVNSTLSSK